MMTWLLRTGCAFGKTDRGVLGCGNSSMEFRDSSKNGLNSSQGTPQRTIRVGSQSINGHGWFFGLTRNQELEVRRKRHKTEGSSIQSFVQQSFSLKNLAATAIASVIFLFAVSVSAGEFGAANAQQKTVDPVEAVGDDFEGMMLQTVYNQMLQANQLVKMGDDNPFAPSNGEMIFRSMQEQAMMQQLAKRRPLGVGSLVARQLRGQTGVGSRILLSSDRATGSQQPQGSAENGHH